MQFVQFLQADPAAATADYRRRARRIRASFSNAPLLRQRALGELATKRNAELKVIAQPEVRVTRLRTVDVIERGFAEHAAARLQPYGFTFSDRVRLLDDAEKLGIPRFRANMILATQEHQTPVRRYATPEVSAKSGTPSLLAILCIEVLIVGALFALYSL